MILTLSAYDPVALQEGNLDPLGLASIADRLASKLVPGIRERMKRPRFLTIIAVGAELTKDIHNEFVPDEMIEPYMAYEWIISQSLFKYLVDKDEDDGFPGRNKVRSAFSDRLPLSTARYLKNATTFGFHGVYRTLSENLQILQDTMLGSPGTELIRIWEEEQNMAGFISGSGPGNEFRKCLSTAIRDTLQKGEVSKRWRWTKFEEIANVLNFNKPGPKEKKFIRSLLLLDQQGFRRQLLNSMKGYLNSSYSVNISDRSFHNYLLKSAGNDLKDILETIKEYERFSRLLTDAFEWILYQLSHVNKHHDIRSIERSFKFQAAFKSVSNIYSTVCHRLTAYNEQGAFERTFKAFSNVDSISDFIKTIIFHHQKVQSAKPPFGKLPWIEQLEERYVSRALYHRIEKPSPNKEYVNFYRTKPLWSFHKDLS